MLNILLLSFCLLLPSRSLVQFFRRELSLEIVSVKGSRATARAMATAQDAAAEETVRAFLRAATGEAVSELCGPPLRICLDHVRRRIRGAEAELVGMVAEQSSEVSASLRLAEQLAEELGAMRDALGSVPHERLQTRVHTLLTSRARVHDELGAALAVRDCLESLARMHDAICRFDQALGRGDIYEGSETLHSMVSQLEALRISTSLASEPRLLELLKQKTDKSRASLSAAASTAWSSVARVVEVDCLQGDSADLSATDAGPPSAAGGSSPGNAGIQRASARGVGEMELLLIGTAPTGRVDPSIILALHRAHRLDQVLAQFAAAIRSAVLPGLGCVTGGELRIRREEGATNRSDSILHAADIDDVAAEMEALGESSVQPTGASAHGKDSSAGPMQQPARAVRWRLGVVVPQHKQAARCARNWDKFPTGDGRTLIPAKVTVPTDGLVPSTRVIHDESSGSKAEDTASRSSSSLDRNAPPESDMDAYVSSLVSGELVQHAERVCTGLTEMALVLQKFFAGAAAGTSGIACRGAGEVCSDANGSSATEVVNANTSVKVEGEDEHLLLRLGGLLWHDFERLLIDDVLLPILEERMRLALDSIHEAELELETAQGVREELGLSACDVSRVPSSNVGVELQRPLVALSKRSLSSGTGLAAAITREVTKAADAVATLEENLKKCGMVSHSAPTYDQCEVAEGAMPAHLLLSDAAAHAQYTLALRLAEALLHEARVALLPNAAGTSQWVGVEQPPGGSEREELVDALQLTRCRVSMRALRLVQLCASALETAILSGEAGAEVLVGRARAIIELFLAVAPTRMPMPMVRSTVTLQLDRGARSRQIALWFLP